MAFEGKCAVCGEAFEARSSRNRFCHSCARVAKMVRDRLVHRGLAAGEEFDRELIRESREEQARMSAAAAATNARRDGVCPYCGKTITSSQQYCYNCRKEGYDDLHRVTGRTNGWDRVKAGKKAVVGGWRGQKVIGGAHKCMDVRRADAR